MNETTTATTLKDPGIFQHPSDTGRDSSARAQRPLSLFCRVCGTQYDASPVAICSNCLGPLDPVYDPTRHLPGREEIARRAPTLWRYAEWLPFDGPPLHSVDSGFTPLIEAPALAKRLGIARAWVKNDAVSNPSLSFKDRVVSTAINAAAGFHLDTIGCASTGNLANAVAAHSARAGLAAWIFVPADLEPGKIIGTTVHGARLVRVQGTYDDVNRLCAQVADRFGWGIVNVNLRSYYGEGSKTMAFEISEQLGWRFPDAVIAPMAGGSLVTKLSKAFGEIQHAGLVDSPRKPRLFGAQAAGCAPIVRALEQGRARPEPVVPNTLARSLAIGSPADGATAIHAIRESNGWAAAVSDAELIDGIRLLAETTGVFTETAGGVTVAAAARLSLCGFLRPSDEVVLCITGNGLKTIDVVGGTLPEAPTIRARLREVVNLVESEQ